MVLYVIVAGLVNGATYANILAQKDVSTKSVTVILVTANACQTSKELGVTSARKVFMEIIARRGVLLGAQTVNAKLTEHVRVIPNSLV